MNEELRKRLIAMIAEDERVRAELAKDGSLFQCYNPQMEAVHLANAVELQKVIAAHGWPDADLAGTDGSEAAWRIVQHAIGHPDFQRSCLVKLREAVRNNKAPAWQAAFLEDRIRFFEGRKQIYGTQADWNEWGELAPVPIEDPERVDELRKSVGLGPLKEKTEAMRAAMKNSNEQAPGNYEERKKNFETWARKTGWRK